MNLLGHDAAWHEWRDAMGGARMHHGWILAGRRGLGKMHFAMAAARELVAEPGIPQPEGDHPDIIVLSHLPKDEKEEKKRGYHVSERRYGSFERSFRIPEDVDAEKIDARFTRGVLTVTLPRKPGAVKAEKKIAVKSG